MAHSNSFPTLITVSQQLNQAHFQQTASSQMQHTALVNSQILFPQCQQTLSLQSAQNGAMTPNAQMNNANGTNKQIQHNRQFQQQQQQQQQQHLTIPVQLGAGNHAFTTAGIPLDLSYFVQGGCLPNCLPIQLTGPGGLQQGFQAALNCVSSGSTGIDPQQQQQVSQQQQQQQTDPNSTPGNSFLQFNVAYQPQHGLLPAFQTVMQQQQQPQQQQQQQQQQQSSSSATGTAKSSNEHSVVLPGKTGPAKRKKRPGVSLGSLGIVATGNCVGANKQDKSGVLGSLGNLAGERFHSVAVQTDFDMTLCRQQIVVVPPKNCTCGAVAQAMASGAFQAASFPPGPRKPDKKVRRSYSGKQDTLGAAGEAHKDELHGQELGEQDALESPPEHDSSLPGDHLHQQQQQQCNGASAAAASAVGLAASSASVAPPPCGAVAQPNCDNRGRPFSYECLYCPKRFSLHSRLVAHLRCHTGMRPFSCLQCGYSFTQRSYLNRHAAVHKQERPFSCLACHKTYKHYGSLANHRKLHSKEAGGTKCGGGGIDQSELGGDAPGSLATVVAPSVGGGGGQHVFQQQQQQQPMLQASLYQTGHDASGSFLVALSQPTVPGSGAGGGAGLVSGTPGGSMLLLQHPGGGGGGGGPGNPGNNVSSQPPHTSSAPNNGQNVPPTSYVPIIMSSASFS